SIQMAVIGADGFLIASTSGDSGQPVYLGDREHFQALMAKTDDELFVGKPVLGRVTGKWTIQLSRRLSRPDGSFAGVIVISLDPGFIDDYFANIDLGPHGAATLRREARTILAVHGLSKSLIGQNDMSPRLRDALRQSTTGAFWGSGSIDRVDRIIAFNRSQQFPV